MLMIGQQFRRLPRIIPLPKLPPFAALMGVWYAVTLHTLWAGLLLFSDHPKNVTGIHTIALLFPAKTGLAIVLLSVAFMAAMGLIHERFSIRSRLALLVPQQIVLGISAGGALHAMVVGHFADGVARPHAFLIADQSPQVIALLIHSATMLYLGLNRKWE